ncbi:MAG TPA: hypothetical protein DCX53_09320 [Anaerolineae bacterium]|nr:hypothetical protein [Anaerolineae bacterium]
MKKNKILTFLRKIGYPKKRSHAYTLVFSAFLVYVAIIIQSDVISRSSALSLAIIPVIGGGWYFGIWGGIGFTILSASLKFIIGNQQESFFNVTNNIDILILLFISAVIGTLGSVTRERYEGMERLEYLESAREDYLKFLENLNEVTKLALRTHDYNQALEKLVDGIGKLFGADDCYFALWDDNAKLTTPVVAYGSMKETFPQMIFEPGERTLAMLVMEAGHPIPFYDLKSSTDITPKITSSFPSRSALGIPLIVGDTKIASFTLGYNDNRTFSDKELTYATNAAQQISLVLMKSQLLEDAQNQVRQLTALHNVSNAATQAETIDQLITDVTEIIGKNLFPDNFGFLLMAEDGNKLHAHPSYRFMRTQKVIPEEIQLGDGVTGQVALTGKSIRVGNIRHAENYINVDQQTKSELCVPIKFKNKVLGVINSESVRANAFTADDEQLLGTIAGQIATTIEQLRAVQAERKWLNQLARSNDLIYSIAHITTHIEKSLSPEDIVQTLGVELDKINFTCVLALYDKSRDVFITNYTSLDLDRLQQLENRIGIPLIHYTFTFQDYKDLFLTGENIYQPVSVSNPSAEIQLLFINNRKRSYSKILERLGVDQNIEVFRLPLMFEDNILGILWIWSKTMSRVDLPIMSIFAKQVGISLERARLFQEIQSLALTDPLTGLNNRRSLFELGRIEFSRARRMNREFSCMMLDLDNFKKINDSHGHPAGDLVLQEFAEHCRNSVRDIDLVGRYGGEEIIILLPETDLKTAKFVAERLRTSLEKKTIKVSNHEASLELKLTVSIGIAGKDNNTLELETLMARADQAMYIAKHKGRNQVAVSV